MLEHNFAQNYNLSKKESCVIANFSCPNGLVIWAEVVNPRYGNLLKLVAI